MLVITLASLLLLSWAALVLVRDARRRSRRVPLSRGAEHPGGDVAEEAQAWLRRQP